MKSLIIISSLLITMEAFGCLKRYTVDSAMLDELPLKVSVESQKTTSTFYLYLNDIGNFEGLSIILLSINDNKGNSIYWGPVETGNKTDGNVYLSFFSISSDVIETSSLTIQGRDPYIDHSTIFKYEISLQLLMEMSVDKDESIEAIGDSLKAKKYKITRE
jgi:hypothetical protein